jgi:protein-tyrosine phosphatase
MENEIEIDKNNSKNTNKSNSNKDISLNLLDKNTEVKNEDELISSKEETGNKKLPNIKNLEKMILLFKAITTMNMLKNDNLPIQIIDNLYIGSMAAAQNKDALVNCKITHIVNSASALKNAFPNDFEYLRIENLLDSVDANIKQYFSITTPFIKNALSNNGVVLVHCHAGISRSSSIIIAYLIECLGLSFDEALKLCQSKRSKICPNQGFVKQLKELEEELKQKDKKEN